MLIKTYDMRQILGSLFFIAFVGYASAQEIKVKESKENIADERNPVLTVLIYEANESDVEKAWKALMKDYNAKVNNKSEIFADNASISDISSNLVDVYAFTKKDDEGVKLVVGFDLGGAFVSSSTHAAEYKAAEKIVRNFAFELSKKAIEEKLDDAEDLKKQMEGELSSLKKKNEKLHSDIEDYKKKIVDAEESIVINEKDQETKTKEIEDQTKVVESVQKKLNDIK